MTARRSGAGTTLVRRPTSSGCELPEVITRLTEASHAHRRAASGVIGPMFSSSERRPVFPSRASRSTVTTTCGRSPATVGRSAESSQPRQRCPSASARRCAGVRRSARSLERISASCTARSAEINVCPVSGSRSPSTRTMPSNVGETCNRLRSRSRSSCSTAARASIACRQYVMTWRSSAVDNVRAASTSMGSPVGNSSGHASRAATSICTTDPETSPAPNASAVPGIVRKARARRRSADAAVRARPHRWASHDVTERKPSTAKDPRRSTSAIRRARSASMMRDARSSSSRSLARPSSPTSRRSSALNSSKADRSVVTSLKVPNTRSTRSELGHISEGFLRPTTAPQQGSTGSDATRARSPQGSGNPGVN